MGAGTESSATPTAASPAGVKAAPALAAGSVVVAALAVLAALVAGGEALFLLVALAGLLAAAAWGWAARPPAGPAGPAGPPAGAAVTSAVVTPPAPTIPPAASRPTSPAVPAAGSPVLDTVLVHLGRRAQALVSLQLEALERAERGASTAELTQLANRLRHNAESLLAAAGTPPPQRWSEPVAAHEVATRAVADSDALGRVRYLELPPVRVAASSVGAVVHVLAELLDIAARSSPPGSPIGLGARRRDDGLVLRVTDQGVGLSEAELDEANRLLAGDAPPAGPSPGAVGFHVAGRVATAAGLRAQVSGGRGGLRAGVLVPASLLDEDAGETASAPAGRARQVERRSGGGRRAAGPRRPVDGRADDPSPRPAEPPVAERTTTARRGENDGPGGQAGGLARRVPGASWAGPSEPVGTPAFRRRPAGRGEEGEAPVVADDRAEARRARLDRFSAGRATAEALIGLGHDAGDEPDDEERA